MCMSCDSHMLLFMQIMALVVLMVGIPVTLMFQIFIPEKSDVVSQRQKWYKWFCNPKFYLVSETKP